MDMRRVTGGLSGAVLLAVVACGGNGGGTTTSPTAVTTTTGTTSSGGTTTPVSNSAAGCEMYTGTGSGPVSGILSHNIALGQTADGFRVTGLTEVLPHASVPDGVRLPDGTLGVYYVNADTDGVWLARLNGTTLTPVSAIPVDGVSRPAGIVDPDAMLVAGKVRLAYLNNFNGGPAVVRNMCVAESSDGVNFKTLGVAWTLGAGATQTDPSEVQLSDGSWLMAISDGTRTRIGRSATGLGFSEFAGVDGGVPELSLTADGRIRLYVCGAGIQSYVSSNNGQSWTSEGIVVPPGSLGRQIVCDPSYVAGAGLLLFKTS